MQKSLTGKHNSDRSEDKETKKDLEIIIKQPKTNELSSLDEMSMRVFFFCVTFI